MLDLDFRKSLKKAVAIVAALVISGCGSGNIRSCGSSPNAVLRSNSLRGAESGLVGGFIELENGRRCTVVIDVLKRNIEGDRFLINAWTSRHCHVEVNPADAASFRLQIFGDGGYYETRAWPIDNLSVLELSGAVSNGKKHALQMGFGAFTADRSIIEEPGANQFAQKDCLSGISQDSSCASVADTVVYSLGVSKRIGDSKDAKLFEILALAFDKRAEVRDHAEEATGLTRQASEFSDLLTDYWRARAHLRLAPMVDFWMICSSEQLRKAYTAFQGKWPVDHLRSSESDSQSPWPVVVDLNPFWNSVEPESLLNDCSAAQKLPEFFDIIDLYRPMSGESLWQELAQLGLREGDKPSSKADVFGFARAMIVHEKDTRQKVLQAWAALGGQIFAKGQGDSVYVHTNIATASGPVSGVDARDVGSSLQYSNIPFFGPAFQGVKSEVLTTGVRFGGQGASPLVFRAGDSGSLFSYMGQFPLVTLNSVDGKGTSGGASVTPLPRVAGSSAPNERFDQELNSGSARGQDSDKGLIDEGRNHDDTSFGDRTSAPVPGTETAQASQPEFNMCY